MTDSIVSNFVPFNNNGLELVVNTSTGKAYASISATARMLETPRSTVILALKGCQDFNVINAEIQTHGGLQGVQLYSSDVVFKLALRYNLSLAEKMGAAGANIYMLGLAGYKVAIEPAVMNDSDKLALMAEGFLKERSDRLALAAKIEADKPLVEYAEAVQHSDTSIGFNEFAKMIGTGQNRLFGAIREAGVIMKNSTLPYQNWCDAGYFEVSQEITENGKLIPFALVTGKGQIWLKQRLNRYIMNQQKMIAAITSSVTQMSFF